ncbi:MAG: hypothetical protein ACOZFS_03895 [Thermodesulfobacteriota bacterium]
MLTKVKKRRIRGKILGVLFMTMAAFCLMVPNVNAAAIDLGLAANWAILAGPMGITLSGGSKVFNTDPSGSLGNVDLTGATIPPPATMAGSLIIQTGKNLFPPDAGTSIPPLVAGGVQQDAAGDALITAAFAAAEARSDFYGTQPTTAGFEGFANITNANNDIDITGKGLVIINVNSILLTQPLGITGGAADCLILNLPAPGSIILLDVITANNPFNLLLNSTHDGLVYSMLNDVDGIWLSPGSEFRMASATHEGAAIASCVHYHSASTLVPLPPSVFLLGSGLIGLTLLGGRRKWFRKD